MWDDRELQRGEVDRTRASAVVDGYLELNRVKSITSSSSDKNANERRIVNAAADPVDDSNGEDAEDEDNSNSSVDGEDEEGDRRRDSNTERENKCRMTDSSLLSMKNVGHADVFSPNAVLECTIVL